MFSEMYATLVGAIVLMTMAGSVMGSACKGVSRDKGCVCLNVRVMICVHRLSVPGISSHSPITTINFHQSSFSFIPLYYFTSTNIARIQLSDHTNFNCTVIYPTNIQLTSPCDDTTTTSWDDTTAKTSWDDTTAKTSTTKTSTTTTTKTTKTSTTKTSTTTTTTTKSPHNNNNKTTTKSTHNNNNRTTTTATHNTTTSLITTTQQTPSLTLHALILLLSIIAAIIAITIFIVVCVCCCSCVNVCGKTMRSPTPSVIGSEEIELFVNERLVSPPSPPSPPRALRRSLRLQVYIYIYTYIHIYIYIYIYIYIHTNTYIQTRTPNIYKSQYFFLIFDSFIIIFQHSSY